MNGERHLWQDVSGPPSATLEHNSHRNPNYYQLRGKYGRLNYEELYAYSDDSLGCLNRRAPRGDGYSVREQAMVDDLF